MRERPAVENGIPSGCRRAFGPRQGQAIVEFAIAFPLQLLIMLSIMQLALIYVGKQVVTYSAYQAARSAAVARTRPEAEQRAHRAAAMICSPITGATVRGSNVSHADIRMAAVELPGWGELPKSGISNRVKTHISSLEFPSPGEVEVTVTHYYELTLPVAGLLFGSIIGRGRADEFDHGTGRRGSDVTGSEAAHENDVGIWNIRTPHMRLRGTARVALPGLTQ